MKKMLMAILKALGILVCLISLVVCGMYGVWGVSLSVSVGTDSYGRIVFSVLGLLALAMSAGFGFAIWLLAASLWRTYKRPVPAP